MDDQHRAAWKAVSTQNLQAAMEDLIRATGSRYDTERIIEQTIKRVLAERTWETASAHEPAPYSADTIAQLPRETLAALAVTVARQIAADLCSE